MPKRTRKPAITTNGKTTMTRASIALLPGELQEVNKLINLLKRQGRTISVSSFGREAIVLAARKQLEELQEAL